MHCHRLTNTILPLRAHALCANGGQTCSGRCTEVRVDSLKLWSEVLGETGSSAKEWSQQTISRIEALEQRSAVVEAPYWFGEDQGFRPRVTRLDRRVYKPAPSLACVILESPKASLYSLQLNPNLFVAKAPLPIPDFINRLSDGSTWAASIMLRIWAQDFSSAIASESYTVCSA